MHSSAGSEIGAQSGRGNNIQYSAIWNQHIHHYWKAIDRKCESNRSHLEQKR